MDREALHRKEPLSPARAIAGVSLVFVLGVVTGAMAGAKFTERRVRAVIETGPESVDRLIVRRLSRQLSLRPDQRAEIAEVIADARRRIRAIREQDEPAIHAILLEAQTAIRARIDAGQAEDFDRLLREGRQPIPF